MKVLFICSGNICRSPMACAWMRHRATGSGPDHLIVESAGLLGIEGAPASPEAIRLLEEHGVDLRHHRSRGVNEASLRTADLIVVMTAHHLLELQARHPDIRGTCRLLRAFESGPAPVDGAPDLADPIGESLETYRECFDTIRTCVEHLRLSLRHDR